MEKRDEDQWYFAYGSNLDRNQKEDRTGAIRAAVVCRVQGYRLVFNKKSRRCGYAANMVPDPFDEVWGVSYLCSEEAMAKMDGWEGGYERREIKVVTVEARVMQAIAYVAPSDAPVGRPTPEYLERIVRGARQHHLPEGYINRARKIGAGEGE